MANISPDHSGAVQLVRSLLGKYDSQDIEHGLSDELGVLGEAQVSAEMRFNTVSHHQW